MWSSQTGLPSCMTSGNEAIDYMGVVYNLAWWTGETLKIADDNADDNGHT